MLSVCIPVYRYDVRPLVQELLTQAAGLAGPVELLVFDDASPEKTAWGQEELQHLPGINYFVFPKNLGRAAIRNKMARDAKYDFLLLMDADGWPTPSFLSTYCDWLKQEQAKSNFVCVGGRSYSSVNPAPGKHLHWYYGRERESKPAEVRRQQPYLGFQSNNFLVAREVLLQHPFPEQVEGYGHEDTLWGQQLSRRQIPIYHLDNPVEHLGLENNQVFLQKQREAIRNLTLLHQQFPHLRTRLIDLANRYPVLLSVASIVPEAWLANYLTSGKRPLLYALDILKLKWWDSH